MQNRIAAALGVLFLISCVQNNKNTVETNRNVASINEQPPQLVYITYKNGQIQEEDISVSRWRGENSGFSAGGREDYLIKMYQANTVGVSRKGLRHLACFKGSAEEVAKNFFNSQDPQTQARNIEGDVETLASQDQRILGVRFKHKTLLKKTDGIAEFRIQNCASGKSTISPVLESSSREPNSVNKATTARIPASDPSFGFSILHKTKLDKRVVPEFSLRADYENATDKERLPWAGLDLRNERQALKFILLVQKYFYENMANQDRNLNYNFIPQNNRDRFWCHMPWMHVGVQGREAIHGLTQERDLRPSQTMPPFMNATPGTNWGVAYFNDAGCRTLGKIFGSVNRPKKVPDWSQSDFEDGTVITKMLFTTSNYKDIEKAYPWYAHVSDVGSTDRQVKLVRHIQMDIAIKDSSLKGINPALKNWLMAAFYYDPNYDYDKEYKAFLGMENPLKSIEGLPRELYRMRPMGVQTGFDMPDTGDSLVFKGSFTNGFEGRLNGPADNPKSSCLGCHGAAGTPVSMVPGFMTLQSFRPVVRTQGFLDFNQQLALAKANYETQFSK
jgi:hypothetical protein